MRRILAIAAVVVLAAALALLTILRAPAPGRPGERETDKRRGSTEGAPGPGPDRVRTPPSRPEARTDAGGRSASPGELSGRVVDALTGEPVPGALVAMHDARPSREASCIDTGPCQYATTTDEDGRFGLPDVAAEALLFVDAPRHAPLRITVPRAGETIRLVPSAEIEGVVRDPDGEPMEGARVLASGFGWFPGDPAALGVSEPRRERQRPGTDLGLCAVARTDARGRYRLTGISCAETVRVRADREGFVRSAVSVVTGLRPEEPTTLDLRLNRGATLVLRVLRSDGHPAVWSHVTLESGVDVLRRTTEADGVVTESRLVPGRYRAFVRAPGCRSTDLDLELRDGVTDEREVVLESNLRSNPAEARTLAGRIVDDDGDPIAGASVRCMGGDPRVVRTGRDGAFSFHVWGTPTAWLDVHAKGFLSSGMERASALDGEPLEIRLRRRCLVRIPLVAPPDRVPERVRVFLETTPSPPPRMVDWPADGLLVVPVSSDVRAVLVSFRGFAAVRVPLEVRPGDTREVPAVRLGAGASVDVTVLGPDGGPLAGASVSAFQLPGAQTGETDRDGRARIAGLLDGVRTTVSTPIETGFVSSPPFVLGDDTRVVALRVLPVVDVEVEIRDSAGLPFARVRVRAETAVTDPGDIRAYEDESTSDHAGRIRLRLRPGPYRLELRPPCSGRDGAEVREIDVRGSGEPVRILTIPR